MKCPICGKDMYRVVNDKGTAHATCSRCNQWVECAFCAGHIVICPPCSVKPAAPKAKASGPIVQDPEPF